MNRFSSAVILVVVMFVSLVQGDLFCQLGVLTPATLEGNNPATGQPWQEGDQYRLVFITSQSVVSQTQEADSISYWNDAVQDIANNATGADLSEVEWRVVGSTSDVDARDNTETNPNVVEGEGHAVFAMNGSSVVATNFVALWDGEVRPERPEWTESGDHMGDVEEAVVWSLTGTSGDGRASSRPMAAFAQIRQGRNADGHHWVNAGITGATWQSSSALSVYGMSEPLEIQGPAGSVIVIE